MSSTKTIIPYSMAYDMKVTSVENRGIITLTMDAYLNKMSLRFLRVNI